MNKLFLVQERNTYDYEINEKHFLFDSKDKAKREFQKLKSIFLSELASENNRVEEDKELSYFNYKDGEFARDNYHLVVLELIVI